MKKSLLALAALGMFAGAASAQSSVTLFGIVDLNYARLSTSGQHIQGLGRSGYNTARLGFRGVEDLGGGLKAGFWIEGELQPDVGNDGGQTWQRRSTVMLSGNFGEFRLGRDYTPGFNNIGAYDPFGTTGMGSAKTFGMMPTSNNVASVRNSNAVNYFLPGNLGGFVGQVMYAFGENVSGTKKENDYWGARLGYVAGPLSVTGAYSKTEGATDAADLKHMSLGASYDFGVVKPMVLLVQEKGNGSAKVQAAEVGLVAVMGQHEVRGAYSRYDQKGGSAAFNDADYNLIAVGYAYNLSKRTNVYATLARVSNDGTQNKSLNSPGLSLATPAGKNQNGVQIGMRHVF